jgi:ribosome-associated protein YbcJ (S4-like RNA binding protein)
MTEIILDIAIHAENSHIVELRKVLKLCGVHNSGGARDLILGEPLKFFLASYKIFSNLKI